MKQFYRVDEDSMVCGVCTGLEEYTGIATIFWRLLFFFGGFGLLYFIIAAFTTRKQLITLLRFLLLNTNKMVKFNYN